MNSMGLEFSEYGGRNVIQFPYSQSLMYTSFQLAVEVFPSHLFVFGNLALYDFQLLKKGECDILLLMKIGELNHIPPAIFTRFESH